MNNLEVVIRYNSMPAKLFLFGIMLLAPVWAILAPVACFVMLLAPILPLFGSTLPIRIADLGAYCSIILAWIALFCVGAGFTVCFADDCIRISKDSLTLPLLLMTIPWFRRTYAWDEISKIDICGGGSSRKSVLVVYLKGWAPIKLKMICFESQQLEEMLLAFEVWAQQTEIGSNLIELKDRLRNDGDTSSPDLSYTALWESELNSRFSTTVFAPLEPGVILQEGRLKIIRQLSFGGLSAIYLCQIAGRELAVLKESVVPDGTRFDVKEKAMQHFHREALHLMRLDHSRIVKVLDFFVEDARTYLLLEYLEGQDLRQFVRRNGAVNAEQALQFGIQIARVLEYLHGQAPPLIHRDISPDNVVRLCDDLLTLIDFGAANEFAGTVTGTLVGKQAYIAPEQFRGKACVQSDIYALGCTLYFLLTGVDPEPLSTSRPKCKIRSIPTAVDDLIADLTAINLPDRIQSAELARMQMERVRDLQISEHKISA